MSTVDWILSVAILGGAVVGPLLLVLALAPFTRDSRVLGVACLVAVAAVVTLSMYQERRNPSEFGGSPAAFIVTVIALLPGLMLGALATLVVNNRTGAD